MRCLIGYTLFLTILKLSQSGCPYSDMMAAASTSAASGAVASSGNGGYPMPMMDSVYGPHPEGYDGDHGYPHHGDEYSDHSRNSIFRSFEGTAKMECAVPPMTCGNDSSLIYYRSFDGSCNNLAHPGYGMANSRYGRLLKPRYGDGKYTPTKSVTGAALPNARVLSLSLFGEMTRPDYGRTMMTMQWGQLVGHDMGQLMQPDQDDCCENPDSKFCYNIPLHVYGPITLGTGKTCQSFTRAVSDVDISCPYSTLGYAEKLSRQTSFLDMGSMYGNSLEQSIKVRSYQGGLLKTVWNGNQELCPVITNEQGECSNEVGSCFAVPDARNQFTPSAIAAHTLFVREHNRLAKILAKLNPHFSDEKLFQVARKINVAQYQKISYYEWLPLLLGSSHCYENHLTHNVGSYDYVNDYNENWHPATYADSAIGALRYGHTTVPGWFTLFAADRYHNQSLRLSDYFQREETVQFFQNSNSFDPLVRGLVTQMEKRADGNVDKELKHYLNRQNVDEFGVDLKAIDIQRGRDFGLPSYNDYREFCGLPRAYHWSDFAHTMDPQKIALLQKFYASPNDVDLNVGGALEHHVGDSLFGPTFQCLVTKQFQTARKSDRFFFEHNNMNAGFTPEQLAEIRKVTLSSVVCANSGLKQIQPNAFRYPNEENNLVSCQSIPQMNLKVWQEHGGY
ncbi:peroxidase [Stomoxys calcitrans]|uniref:peroxidase n=1 Tax=Stomoxys calcitrans TaxID=35570 RepID=UPI0027E23F32|nr:peroxidase [Stomoxys calcitrans]